MGNDKMFKVEKVAVEVRSMVKSKKYTANGISESEALQWAKEEVSKMKSEREVRDSLINAFSKLAAKNIPVDTLKMHPGFYATIRNYFRDEFDPVTLRVELKKGHVGTLWNAEVWVDKKLGENEVVVIGEKCK